jgi:hypothetical protein
LATDPHPSVADQVRYALKKLAGVLAQSPQEQTLAQLSDTEVSRTTPMTAPWPELLDVLRIAHMTSLRGQGLSMSEALQRARYRDRRTGFGAADLRPLLDADPEVVEAWLAYSEDKRTNGGWYLLRSGEIGRVGNPEARLRFASTAEAAAEYVVRELDFWAGLERTG